MQDIHLLFSCDAWKAHSSRRLIMVTIDNAKLLSEIKRQVNIDNMQLEEQACLLNSMGNNQINGVLKFGYVATVKDGEIQ